MGSMNCSCLTPNDKSGNATVNIIEEEQKPQNDKNPVIVVEKKVTPRGLTPSQSIRKKKQSNSPSNSFFIQADPETKLESPSEDNQFKKRSSTHLAIEAIQERRLSKVENRTNINIVLIGESGVGKSTFRIKYCEGKFERFHVPTIGKEIAMKKVKYNHIDYILKFIDTTGTNEFKEDYTSAFKDVDFFLMFYDITNRNSYEKLKESVQDIKNYCFQYKNSSINVIFLGNKVDEKSKRQVPFDEASNYCKKNNIDLYEISLVNNSNVNKVINKIVETFDDMASNQKEASSFS